ncbi:MAG: hypothetical protein GYB31_19685 [Bacteroidetes bacterium]|nr:hypothetical protein [Bacteroidota bacterium]
MVAHIGFPKTGTTYLQKNVFPHHPELNAIENDVCRLIFRDLINQDDLDFKETQTIADCSSLCQNDQVDLFSLEFLVGHMFINTGLNRSAIAKRLKAIGFNKIIITIRNQTKIIDSTYRQYVHQGGTIKFPRFIRQFPDIPYRIFEPKFYDYYKTIDWYHSIFGKENVLVVLQEEMFSEPDNFKKRLQAFLELKKPFENTGNKRSNKSLSNLSIGLLRWINHFTYHYFQPSQFLWNKITTWKIRILLQEYIDPYFLSHFSNRKNYLRKYKVEDEFKNLYKEGNNLLVQKLGLPLDKYGYPL